jgi:hypothetical protein
MNAERVEEFFFILDIINSRGQEFLGGGFSEAYVLFGLPAQVNPFRRISPS